MAKTIFDLVTSKNITTYWETMTKDRQPFLGETLFPNQKKLGLDLKWIKGSSGIPVVLKPSAFDANAIPRTRIGFDQLSADMPFFKESLPINETLRQQLNMLLGGNNPEYVKVVLDRIFNDNMALLEAAAVRREQMRMMALTTGAISIKANGQNLEFDYGMPSTHKVDAAKAWSDSSADIGADIMKGQDTIEADTGIRPTRAVCGRKVWNEMLKNDIFKKSIYVLSQGQATLTDNDLKKYLMDKYNLEVLVYSKQYKNDAGTPTKYVPDDVFVLFPTGDLGYTWFGTTPEESDLLTSRLARVSITDTGVAVTTMEKPDPVTIEVKATMITLPSFEMADRVYILDTTAA